MPTAWPKVNYHSEQVCFANFRTILKKMGLADKAEPASIEFNKVGNVKKLAQQLARGQSPLRIVASHFPPIDGGSFVLVREAKGKFSLKRYRTIAQKARSYQVELTGYKISIDGDRVQINNLKVPDGYRFIIVSRKDNTSEMIRTPMGGPVIVRARAGNKLGRVNVYRCFDESDPVAHLTRIAEITLQGHWRTTFFTIQNSIDQLRKDSSADRLNKSSTVIDLGDDWSVEMFDFQRAATRQIAITQLKMLLSYPAFDEIFINTRSHCQLGGSSGDPVFVEGPVRPLEYYRGRTNYHHLGIDRAFAPISLAANKKMLALAKSEEVEDVQQLTAWQDNEWIGPCQKPNSPFAWQYERNRAVADGVRQLLVELQSEFPGVRIRVVIPPSEDVIRAVEKGLDKMPKIDGSVYGRKYYRSIRGSRNYIQAIGEGMAMADLTGLSVEPVFLGIRYTPDSGPLDLYLRENFRDMAGNKGSTFRGPRSFFYEAQETLRGKNTQEKRKKREEIICKLLSHSNEIKEVILYEAADWTYFLPLSDPDHCGHGYLDRCNLKP